MLYTVDFRPADPIPFVVVKGVDGPVAARYTTEGSARSVADHLNDGLRSRAARKATV
jgi:hypothetical protein